MCGGKSWAKTYPLKTFKTPYSPQIAFPSNFWPTYESELVEIIGVEFENQGRPFTVGVHAFTQVSTGEVGYIYTRSNHPLLCTPIPYVWNQG